MKQVDVLSPKASRYSDALADAARGVPGALEPLVKQFSPMLWRVARAQNLDAASAEDVVQTTWLKLMHSLADISEPAALPGWLATTARREAWRRRRADERERPTDAEWDSRLPAEPNPDDDVLTRIGASDRDRALWEAVSTLNDRCRELVQIIAHSDRPSYGDIAEALGIPRNSVGPNRGRCLTRLRDALAADPRWRE
ncbi:RNA polymerase sigma factor [Stackebrandtia soli]|uniref:RNA polymerase sigma factor n=1 Tax=Stackebrandtia soli TaxID=1892856 RepID=UPI0039E9A879